MSARRAEWGERISALVLLLAAIAVAGWSNARIAATEAALDERERELQRIAAPPHAAAACSPGDAEAPRPLPVAASGR